MKTRIQNDDDDQAQEHMFLVLAPSINNRQPLSAYSQPSKALENGLDEDDADDDDSAEYELEILDENPLRPASNGFIVPNTWREENYILFMPYFYSQRRCSRRSLPTPQSAKANGKIQ